MLGIVPQTFCKYKTLNSELKEALKDGRTALVENLYNTLFKKAAGFEYTEKKIIKEKNPDTGQLEVVREEINIKQALPDVAALHLLLKNYDREKWTDNPAMLELKKQEIEIQKQKAENAGWD